MAGQLGLLLGVGIVEEALGSGIVDIPTEDVITTGLDDSVGTEEGVQETPVGYSMYNNYVKPK